MSSSTIALLKARSTLVPVVLMALGMTGCDTLLGIEDDPNTIGAEGVEGEGAFRSRTIGAASDFAVAVGDAVVYGGLFTDELIWGGSFVRRDEIDRRSIDPTNDIVADEPYTTLQISAKASKDLQTAILDGNFSSLVQDPANSAELAQVSLFSGYSRLYLADLFCTLAFNNTGPELTSEDVYEIAIDDFTAAINAASASEEVRNAAFIGRARARLQLGRTAEAAADAAAVPEGFQLTLQYSGNSGRETNTIWGFTWGNRRLVVGPEFHEPMLDGAGIVDPRVQVVNTGQASFSGNSELWAPQEYASRAAPITIASWQEAQYILAEIQGGAAALQILNDLRAVQGIGTPIDAGATATQAAMLRKIAEEKSRALLLRGYRMADSRRYLERYSIDLFPTGPRHGTQTCMPLPNKERDNNPGL